MIMSIYINWYKIKITQFVTLYPVSSPNTVYVLIVLGMSIAYLYMMNKTSMMQFSFFLNSICIPLVLNNDPRVIPIPAEESTVYFSYHILGCIWFSPVFSVWGNPCTLTDESPYIWNFYLYGIFYASYHGFFRNRERVVAQIWYIIQKFRMDNWFWIVQFLVYVYNGNAQWTIMQVFDFIITFLREMNNRHALCV